MGAKVTIADMPATRGRVIENARLSDITWFRVGGPADILYTPDSEDDLREFLSALDPAIPVFPMGVGSNLLVRDGGLRGVVVRLAGGFNKVEIEGVRVRAGAAALDAQVAKRAAAAGVAGLEFFRGVPGAIGGALRMNAGAYGSETKDVLVEARAVDRAGAVHVLTPEDMEFGYRHCGAPADFIFTQAVFEGRRDDPEAIESRMKDIMQRREESQPIRERTGGSTFANPDPAQSDGLKSWQLIDKVGGRGRVVGDAQVSTRHCNFLINRGEATGADLETLGESVREDVKQAFGVNLRWEIKRIGEPL